MKRAFGRRRFIRRLCAASAAFALGDLAMRPHQSGSNLLA
ncbi:twin-arginine translocation signal domain-containing protein [Seohaeicola nanhaiensis]|uniref:Twin-arginine translocation signal domain-containing protein n=1 Tax=Seohaeicola nanhaiensis TaxID=1387282 RepID=A0ABV9KLG7_9RHOB